MIRLHNELVVCLMDEECETGVIIGAIYNDEDHPDEDEDAGKFRKVFTDGTIIEYNKNIHTLTIQVEGVIKVVIAGNAQIEASTINLKGNVIIEGDITSNGNIDVSGSIGATGDITSGGKSLQNHKHTGVQAGGGISGPPQ